ncbi:penicillin-binding protein [Marininema mesophilum]|uniref:Penicillin-binding protein n=1 Tax=Marininema mesophilum TaxID=1048340 RepID=A0A1H2Y0X5_9BACL|nr:transglycosylase domain-containing protein [Marininema mesophilum]SDW98812.1 penicillin-binding protein [Marininema mesophilum]
MADQQSKFPRFKKMKKQMTNNETKKRPRPWLRGVLFAGLVVVTLLAVGTMASVGAATGYVASLVKKEPVRDKSELREKISKWSQTSSAFFDDGKPIGRLRADADRQVVTMDNVSPYIVNALVSTEDQEFFRHHGVVPRSLLRAVMQKIKNAPEQTGGSTITQQLVKNAVLDNRDKTIARKAKEILLAVRLDSFFSKKEIMSAYLNSVYFGKGVNNRNMLGVQAAAQGMFGIKAKDLNLAQSAYIAGMVQRPNEYNPFRGKKYIKNGEHRMRVVLYKMLKNKKITKAQYEKARQFDIEKSLAKKAEDNAYSKYPYITMALEDEAASILLKADGHDPKKLIKAGKYGETLQRYKTEILTGGYKIYTTINKEANEEMNKAAKNDSLYAAPITYRTAGGNLIKNAKEQVGATLLDSKTGATLGFVGGRNFKENQQNHAIGNSAPQQPGSSIKPLLDFGPAFDKGVLSPESMLVDEPLSHSGGVYQNYTHRYDGPMTARSALMKSINIPAIKALRAVGVQAGLDYLRKMNFPINENDGEASAIGGFTYGFTPQRMASGYAMLANQGKFNEPYMIDKIEDSNGKVVYQHKKDPIQILSPQAAYWTTDMLRDVVRKGTGTYVGARTSGYDLAGKTGTTNSTADIWFMGYTPDITLGVWVGYDYDYRLPSDQRARIVWAAIFNAITKNNPELSPIGSRFKSEPPLSYKCFECNKVSEQKDDSDDDDDGNNINNPSRRPPSTPAATTGGPGPGTGGPGTGPGGGQTGGTPTDPPSSDQDGTGDQAGNGQGPVPPPPEDD